ncbi:MAG: response regulator transcription factor [Comamonadaceae bacterium]|nr:MAG: response regulator transcription factor [Comamonadaceae bacterium]
MSERLNAVPHVEVAECAATETEAINWLVSHQGGWNLAIVDLELAQGSGLRVLSACRVRHPRQKMVVLSNHMQRDSKRRCTDLGADATFDKATDLDRLLAYCRTMAGDSEASTQTDLRKL